MTGWHVTGPPGSKAPAGGVQSLSGLSASAAVADGGLVLPAGLVHGCGGCPGG